MSGLPSRFYSACLHEGFFSALPVLWSLQHGYFPLKTILEETNTMNLEGMVFYNKLTFEREQELEGQCPPLYRAASPQYTQRFKVTRYQGEQKHLFLS